jgi:phage terminase large subunit-like protein
MTLYDQFIDDVQKNHDRHNKFVKLAVQRHLNDLKNDRFFFDTQKADRVIAIVKLMRHTSGSYGGKLFDLQPFQAFIIAMLYGWTDKSTGYRRFRKAYIETARKSGKSELAAALQIYSCFFDGEHASQVFSCANTRDQANFVYAAATSMAKSLARDSQKFAGKSRVMQYRIVETETTGYITRLTADASTQDGASPSFAVIDEYHAAPSDALLKVIETGIGARLQPLIYIVTTSGFHKGACYDFRKVVADVLDGKVENNSLFGIMFTLDEGDDWQNENVWIKANPNLGNSPRIEQMRALYQNAVVEGGSSIVEFKTKNLCLWTDAAKVWISDENWISCQGEVQEEGRCIIGIDLSSRVDVTAITYLWPETKSFRNHYYVPEEKANQGRRADGVDYKEWVAKGYVTATPGNVIDYDYIIRDLLDSCEKYNVELIGYDPYNADLIVPKLEAEGVSCGAVRQGFITLSPATKRLETMVLSREIVHDDNPVDRWMMGNVEIEQDAAGNIKPSKGKSQNKIDGVASLVTAIAAWMSTELNREEEMSMQSLRDMFG